MNDLCSNCGKPPHFGSGCKVGPASQEENAALKKHSEQREAKCGICMSHVHETSECPQASDPAIKQYSAKNYFLQADNVKHPFDTIPQEMRELLMDCIEVQRTKGYDYTQGRSDRLANFRREVDKWGITMRQAWGVYFDKHVCAIETYVKQGDVRSEPIRGRILDCINYLLLLELIRVEEGSVEAEHPTST